MATKLGKSGAHRRALRMEGHEHVDAEWLAQSDFVHDLGGELRGHGVVAPDAAVSGPHEG